MPEKQENEILQAKQKSKKFSAKKEIPADVKSK